MKITKKVAQKVLSVVDKGLTSGMGTPVPGQMCVEAAVCFALGLPHGDNPPCVSPAVRRLKIHLNDSAWSSNTARAAGMRALSIAQLGTNVNFDDTAFATAVVEMTIRVIVPIALRTAAKLNPRHAEKLEAAAKDCEGKPTRENAEKARRAARAAAYAADAAANAAANAAYAAANAAANAAYAAANAAAYAAANAAYAAANAAYAADAAANAAYAAATRDSILSRFADEVVKIMTKLGAEGTQYFDLL